MDLTHGIEGNHLEKGRGSELCQPDPSPPVCRDVVGKSAQNSACMPTFQSWQSEPRSVLTELHREHPDQQPVNNQK